MPACRYRWWIWKDDVAKVAFVGYGATNAPWSDVWQNRQNFDSELNQYLRSLPALPRAFLQSDEPMYATEARAQVAGSQKLLKSDGYRILSSRNKATIRAGRQKPRPISVHRNGKTQWFPSVRSAARALRLDPSSVTLAAQDPNRQDINYAP